MTTMTSAGPLSAQPTAHSPAAPCPTLTPARLARAKKAYTTRYAVAAVERATELLTGPAVRPRSGDLVLARVEEIGQHKRLEGPQRQRQALFTGDEIVVAYGNRYAPDQFEAEVPGDLGPVELVAAGGMAGRVLSQHAEIEAATRLAPLGLLARNGSRLTLAEHAPLRIREQRTARVTPRVVVVLGTSMNSGKTATVASLVHGLVRSGLHVAAGKATGTGAGGDPGLFVDAGASSVLDFTDYGLPSTYRLGHDRVRALLSSLVEDLAADGPDVVVVEIADGLLQDETQRLLDDPLLRALADDVLFAAGDALGAAAGYAELQRRGLPLRAVSGLLTASPLAHREAGLALGVPVLGTFDLCEPDVARSVLA